MLMCVQLETDKQTDTVDRQIQAYAECTAILMMYYEIFNDSRTNMGHADIVFCISYDFRTKL